MRKYQKFYSLPRHPDVTCEGVEHAFEHLNFVHRLSRFKQLRLFFRLSEARSSFDLRYDISKAASGKAGARDLKMIAGSIRRIAAFGRQALRDENELSSESAALALLNRAAENWARNQPRDGLPSYFQVFIEEYQGIDVSDFGSAKVLRRFFETAALIEAWLSDAKNLGNGKDRFQFETSPSVWLVGRCLPTIYQSTFGRKFSISRASDQKPSGRGVAFVKAALEAIAVRPNDNENWSAETIVSYVKRAREA